MDLKKSCSKAEVTTLMILSNKRSLSYKEALSQTIQFGICISCPFTYLTAGIDTKYGLHTNFNFFLYSISRIKRVLKNSTLHFHPKRKKKS